MSMNVRSVKWFTPLLFAAVLVPLDARHVQSQQTADTRPGIAVLPFSQGVSIGANAADLSSLGIGLQQILITELAQNTNLRVVDRTVLRDLLAEQELGEAGRVDPATAARVGKVVGARYVFTGGFNDVDGQFRLDGRIVDVETSEIVKAEQVTGPRDNLYRIVVDVSERVMNAVNLPPLAPEVRSERQSRAESIPRQAVILYSQAQFFQDRGETERAKELYRRITDEFPRLTEAREALRQIETTSN